MNLPNKLTVLRVIMIPFFVFFYLNGYVVVADILFILASLTDLADGKIARKYNLVTNFGKFMDPLADKLLVAAALICFVEEERIASWIVLIIISREFIISGFRLVAAEGGKVIAAGYWGKLKTAVTMVTIVLMIPNFGNIIVNSGWISIVEHILVYASLILTVVSLIDYFVKNKDVLGGEM